MAEHINTLASNKDLQRTIEGAISGTLPMDRRLKSYEPAKLNPRSIQVVLLRMVGYRNRKVSELTGYSQVTVSNILKHPYSKRIMAVAFSSGVAQAASIQRRLQKRAPRMLDVVEEIALDTRVKPTPRLKAAFGWLDRAGHNPTQKSEENRKVSAEIKITSERADLIAESIREAKGLLPGEAVEDADYSIEETASPSDRGEDAGVEQSNGQDPWHQTELELG
jgi:DNA-binding CsgD family transcriptional regulator